MIFSEEQQRRLGELGATSEDLQAGFADSAERNRAFQRLESRLVTEQHERLDALCEGPRRPFILELEERLSAVLRTAGFPSGAYPDHPVPRAPRKNGRIRWLDYGKAGVLDRLQTLPEAHAGTASV